MFDLIVTGKPRDYIADLLGMSVSTVDRRLRDVRAKIDRVGECVQLGHAPDRNGTGT